MTTLPPGQAYTRADLGGLPDDGRRHELIDGTLVVSPAPSPRAEQVGSALTDLLRAACPASLRVLNRVDVDFAPDTVLQPDLMVVRSSEFYDLARPLAPLLAVEIITPSTRDLDLYLKPARYQAARCPSYWVVDPDEPGLVAWDLLNGRYVGVAHVVGEQTYAARLPFPVNVTPSQLVG